MQIARPACHLKHNQDIPMIMGVVLFSAILVVVFNAIADLAYRFVDPRIQ